MPSTSHASQRSCLCVFVLGISMLPLSTILQVNFWTVLIVWYVFWFSFFLILFLWWKIVSRFMYILVKYFSHKLRIFHIFLFIVVNVFFLTYIYISFIKYESIYFLYLLCIFKIIFMIFPFTSGISLKCAIIIVFNYDCVIKCS